MPYGGPVSHCVGEELFLVSNVRFLTYVKVVFCTNFYWIGYDCM